MLEEDFGLRTTAIWARQKFGIEFDVSEIRSLEIEELKQRIYRRAEESYDRKESEYPVMAGLYRFSSGAGPHSRIDRDGLIHWARDRFEASLDLEDLRNKQRDEIRALLLKHSAAHQQRANAALQDVKQKIDTLFASGDPRQTASLAPGGNGAVQSLSYWLHDQLHYELSTDEIGRLNREELEQRLVGAVEDRYRPEIRRMERSVLLQIVDAAWKDHLLAMDHLRSSIGLSGYAQLDPKVEYKREGMRLFDLTWTAMGERVTDLIFRMEQLDEEFVGSTWVETAARHDEAGSPDNIASQQEAAIQASQGEVKIETIRNRAQRVGRNDPCPCGSGKKYKQCCLRKTQGV